MPATALFGSLVHTSLQGLSLRTATCRLRCCRILVCKTMHASSDHQQIVAYVLNVCQHRPSTGLSPSLKSLKMHNLLGLEFMSCWVLNSCGIVSRAIS